MFRLVTGHFPVSSTGLDIEPYIPSVTRQLLGEINSNIWYTDIVKSFQIRPLITQTVSLLHRGIFGYRIRGTAPQRLNRVPPTPPMLPQPQHPQPLFFQAAAWDANIFKAYSSHPKSLVSVRNLNLLLISLRKLLSLIQSALESNRILNDRQIVRMLKTRRPLTPPTPHFHPASTLFAWASLTWKLIIWKATKLMLCYSKPFSKRDEH
jgi:hypothetical protein